MREVYFFDPNDDVTILERRLPHWSQAGVVCFITFRTSDSIPHDVLARFHADRRHWLRRNHVNPDADEWRDQLHSLDKGLQDEFLRTFSTRWHKELDQGRGACVLRDPDLSQIVHNSLLHFDGDRYEVTDFVIMPNHVHLLVAFTDDDAMLTQCESWKRFTATAINRELGASGRFWQQDGFDHLVRSAEQFEHFQRYIAENPKKANLKQTEYRHYSK